MTFDYLGPATPEQVAEVKAARKAEQRKAIKETLAAYLLLFVVAAFFALGTVVGDATDSNITDIEIPLPFTPEPSGERAEPEESAR